MISETVRDDFPLLRRRIGQHSLCYLDSAATSLKPRPVIDTVVQVLENHTANVHRAANTLGDEATDFYEGARRKLARFIGAEEHEIVFTRNTTEGLNLVAKSWRRPGRILVSASEHHSNLLCWPKERTTILAATKEGTLDIPAFLAELEKRDVAIVAVSAVSNVTGYQTALDELVDVAHRMGAIVVVDAAQSVPHLPVDVYELDCDFLAFSSHKMCGPSGIGALFGKADWLAEMDHFLRGGATVNSVSLSETISKQPPWRFEAGTPAIEAAAGFGAAVDYLSAIGMEEIAEHECQLVQRAVTTLSAIKGLRLVGPTDRRVGPVTFTFEGPPVHAVARMLCDSHGVMVRSGYHCAQPLHEQQGIGPTLRVSFYLYNNADDIERVAEGLNAISRLGGLR